MRRPGSVPTTRAGRPGRTLWVSSHCVASRSTPPAATITATVSGDEVTASAGPTTSIAACKSRPRSVQNPWNACDSGITLSRDTATPPRPQSFPRGLPGQSRSLVVANLESYCHLSRPKTDPKWCLLGNDSLSTWRVCPWEGISLTYQQFAADQHRSRPGVVCGACFLFFISRSERAAKDLLP